MPDSITVAASKLDADPMNVRKSYSAGEPDSPSPRIPFPPGCSCFQRTGVHQIDSALWLKCGTL